MQFHTMLGVGFVQLVLGGFGDPGPNPIDTGFGVPISGYFHAPVIRSLPGKPSTKAPAGIKIPLFRSSEFPFVTIVPDDRADKAGGWQEAKADLEFFKVVVPVSIVKWKCRIAIKVPLRTERMGKIPPSLAADMSAGITNMVTIGMDFDLPQGIFCDRFVTEVEATFKATYPKLGSRVTRW